MPVFLYTWAILLQESSLTDMGLFFEKLHAQVGNKLWANAQYTTCYAKEIPTYLLQSHLFYMKPLTCSCLSPPPSTTITPTPFICFSVVSLIFDGLLEFFYCVC